MQNFLEKHINIFLIYIFLKEKYAILPTLRLILSVLKRMIILISKLNLNNNLKLFYNRNCKYKNVLSKIKYLQILNFIILKEILKYKNLLNYKYYIIFIEYSSHILKTKIKIIINLINISNKKIFAIIFIKKLYIFIGYFLILSNILCLIIFYYKYFIKI
jgi:hypothetical protein